MAEPEPEPEPDVPTFQFSRIMDVFLPQTQTTETEERGWSELPAQEDDGSPHRPQSDGFPQFDISAALMSVALKQTWTPEKRFSASEPNEDQSFSSFDDQDKDANGEEDPDKEVLGVTFQSKFMHIFPLYQDYCLQAVRKDLLRFDKTFLSELISPEFLQSVQSCLSPSGPPEVSQPLLRSAEVTCPSPLAQPIRVTPCTLWHQLDEVKASGLIGSLTSREIHLQESMFELIGSEASYLRSLGVAVDHFYASKALRRTLPRMEHHILFSNIRPIRAASEKFLVDLELRLGQSVLISQVGDIVLQHCPEFHSLYVPYVTNMMYQEALVNQLLQQNKDFVCSLKKLESDPLCQRQNLKSFLVLPFQRITRMKLLLENVLKLNEPESESVSNLEKAIQAIHEIVTECNNGVRKMKRIEELVSLETLLDFDKVKAFPGASWSSDTGHCRGRSQLQAHVHQCPPAPIQRPPDHLL
ncbi:rho guanine nucleotide exchange factor 5 isoform X2 [Cynoglossus semilaevis]|uniref:rho guanine nucleotide exchange factor 5 isoform X2 n=1 Tax=Cynoglossus semilaevis TaxID=244447 RepID=UPI0004952A39|nr:rho guanine nucleotide exchange factor 5 isoform X2 [Cynoglossus semilaevis]